MPKRRAAAVSDDEDDHDGANGSTASKRARTADSDSDEERVPPARKAGKKANGRAKRDDSDDDDSGDVQMNGGDDVEEEERKFEEEYDNVIFEAVRNRFKKKMNSSGVAEMGILESIELSNFMCHKRLTFNFGPQINFIIGHNGSGKSAVLSGITVALGGKATSTGRGSGLKSFIREGQPAAEVSVTIKNQGDEAYKPEEYGKSIVITRRFTKEGSSTWKICSKDNKKKAVSTKKEELAAICDHMNIQVDNPMSVLTQDAARQFLSASTPQDKYKFFLKGTQLAQLSDEYDTCLGNIQQTAKILAVKKEALPDLQTQFKEVTLRYEEAEKALEQKRKLDDLKKEKAWAHVKTKHDELVKKLHEKTKAEANVPKAEANLKEQEERLEAQNAKVEEHETAYYSIGNAEDLKVAKKKNQDEIKANKAEIQKFQSDLSQMDKETSTAQKTIKELEAEIKKQRDRLASDTQAKRDQRQQDIDAAKTALDEADAEVRQVAVKFAEAGKQKDAKIQIGQEILRNMEELKKQLTQADDTIKEAGKMEKDRLSIYGNNIASVHMQIERARWFGEKPIGPLGVHVKLREGKDKWGDLLRQQLVKVLMSFAITDTRDRPTLKKILQNSNNNHVSIIISQRDMFDFSQGEPPQQFETVLRALEIDDPVVLRILINQSRIEKRVLFDTRKEADFKMRESLPGGEAWTLDYFNVRSFREGGGVSNPLPPPGRVSGMFLRGANVRDVSEIQSGKKKTEGLLQEKQKLYSQGQQEYNQLRTSFEKAQREQKMAEVRARTARERYRNLQDEANEELPAEVGGLEAARLESEKEIESIREQFDDVLKQKKKVDDANKELTESNKKLQAEIDDLDDKKSSAMKLVEKASTDRAQIQGNIEYWKKKIDVEEGKVKELDESVKTVEEEYSQWRGQALEYTSGEEVPNPRHVDTIVKSIEAVQKALEQRERNHGATVEEMTIEVNRVKEKLDRAEGDYRQMNKLNKALKASLCIRLYRWQDFRRHIALRCKHIFSYHLSQRGYFGKLLFSHTEQTLTLRVQTDDQVATQGGTRDKDPRSLSGGEKSFSTICLLLSLWESIGCPLRCLDEFDVFMDAVNRRISMRMMIETANASDKKQYILITPQDMSNVDHGPSVRIQRMPDPERGQGMLEFRSN